MSLRDFPTIIRIGGSALIRKIPYFPIIASFDATNACTLHCKHCYWWEDGRKNQLSDDKFYKNVKELKHRHPTIISVVWLGGEPLLRKELIEKCRKLFSFNEIITNGTIPLPNWKDVRFACSVDGTKKYYERQQAKGVYEKVKKNINQRDLNVNINCVLTRINADCLEDFVEEWSLTDIKSIGFSFYTPIKGKKDNDIIWLDFNQRDRVIDRIISLKHEYPDLINSSEKILRNFRSDRCKIVTQRCRNGYVTFCSMCSDSEFKRKFPCVIGLNAVCEKCGCIVYAFGEQIQNGDLSFLWDHIKGKLLIN